MGAKDGSHYIYSEDGEPTGYFYDDLLDEQWSCLKRAKEKETDDGRE